MARRRRQSNGLIHIHETYSWLAVVRTCVVVNSASKGTVHAVPEYRTQDLTQDYQSYCSSTTPRIKLNILVGAPPGLLPGSA